MNNFYEKALATSENNFGEVLRMTGDLAKTNPFRFSTKYQDDESDLLYFGYRYYNASTGRWISRDPIGEQGGYNLYALAENHPVAAFDVLGLTKGTGSGNVNTPGKCLIWCKTQSDCKDRERYDYKEFKFYRELVGTIQGPGRMVTLLYSTRCSCYCPPKCDTCSVGPFSSGSIVASKADDVTSNEALLMKIFVQLGSVCHTCGSPIAGTPIADHQPPTQLVPPGTPQRLYPQCQNCSRRQGGDVNGCLRHKEWYDRQPGRRYGAGFWTFLWGN